MGHVLTAMRSAFGIFWKDKLLILLALIPISIGITIFYFLGKFFYTDLRALGEAYVMAKVQADAMTNFIKALLIVIFTVLFYFLLSWTFVLVVSIIAAPFNDFISSRVEKAVLGRNSETIDGPSNHFLSWVWFTLKNESKKVFFIIIISTTAFLLSFIPVLFPITLFISSLLMATQFLDYSWSRHDMTFSECLGDIRSNLISYGLPGLIFLLMIAIPIVNVFMLPYAVVFYTYLFSLKKRDQIAHQI